MAYIWICFRIYLHSPNKFLELHLANEHLRHVFIGRRCIGKTFIRYKRAQFRFPSSPSIKYNIFALHFSGTNAEEIMNTYCEQACSFIPGNIHQLESIKLLFQMKSERLRDRNVRITASSWAGAVIKVSPVVRSLAPRAAKNCLLLLMRLALRIHEDGWRSFKCCCRKPHLHEQRADLWNSREPVRSLKTTRDADTRFSRQKLLTSSAYLELH